MMKYSIDDKMVETFYLLIKEKLRSFENTPECIKERIIEKFEEDRIKKDGEN